MRVIKIQRGKGATILNVLKKETGCVTIIVFVLRIQMCWQQNFEKQTFLKAVESLGLSDVGGG